MQLEQTKARLPTNQMPVTLEIRRIFLTETEREPCVLRTNRKNGVFGVKEMQAVIVGKTIERHTDGTSTTLHVDAVWPLGDGKTHRRDFEANGKQIGDPWNEWRLERTSR